jgi:hypothetical protein
MKVVLPLFYSKEKNVKFCLIGVSFLSFWVGVFIDRFELFDGIVRIHLGGGQATVSQQFFDCVKVGSVVGEVGSKGVA